ncbi:hypothetical protein [Streptomyces sp. NPDC002644]
MHGVLNHRVQASRATGLGHGTKALELANAAAAASPTANPRMHAFFAGQQAHAAAQAGDRTGALRHLSDAETAMDRAESHVGVIGSYNPAALNYHVSQVRHEVGDTPGAIRALQLSDRSRVSTDRVIRVVHRCTIAERQLRIGHLDAACAPGTTSRKPATGKPAGSARNRTDPIDLRICQLDRHRAMAPAKR